LLFHVLQVNYLGDTMSFSIKSSGLFVVSVVTLAVGSVAAAGLIVGQSAPAEAQIAACANAVNINGGGLTFGPLFQGLQDAVGVPDTFAPPTGSWFNTFGCASSVNTVGSNPPGPVNSGFRFNYASQGSGGGVTEFLDQNSRTASPTVPNPFAFAITGAPLTQAQLTTFQTNLTLFGYGYPVEVPLVAAPIALAYSPTSSVVNNTPLTTSQWCAAFNGNPSGPLAGFTGVRRSDSSGTTQIVATQLTQTCGPLGLWQTAAGVARGSGATSVPDTNANCAIAPGVAPRGTDTVCWPASFLSGSGNPGVANTVLGASTRFGYVELATALGAGTGTGLRVASLQNAAGNFVLPGSPSTVSALLEATTNVSTSACRVVLSNPGSPFLGVSNDAASNSGAYPIVGFAYGLFYGDYYPDASPVVRGTSIAAGIQAFVAWSQANTNGGVPTQADAIAIARGYAPLPNSVKSLVRTAVQDCVGAVVNGDNGTDSFVFP
jgi:phosphate transport system substrate-binding protein